MSDTDTLAVDDLAPPSETDQPEQAQAEIPTLQAQPAEDDEHPEAVEIKAGEKYVPVGALRAVRQENKTLKAKAEQADRLEQEVANIRPYVQFLQANPHLLQPQAQQPPAPPPPATADPVIEATAKRYQLYKPDGTLDLDTATAIVDDQRKVAREEAERVIAPVTERTHQTQLNANIQWMASLKTADGQALEQSFIEDTVRSIYGALPKAEALKVLADPQVAQVVGYVALGRQASLKKGAPAPHAAPGPALVVESPGGNSDVRFSDGSRALFSKAGISEKDAMASAKRFKPNQHNSLE